MTTAFVLPIASYGYASVLFFVFVQSTGIPFPGAAVVVPVAAYAATTHDLSILLILTCAGVAGFHLVRGPQGIAITAIMLLILFRGIVVVGRNMRSLAGMAESAYPGPVVEPRQP